MLMSLVAGVMVDRLGTRVCVFIFLGFCVAGQALYSLGPTLDLSGKTQFIIMFIGRFLFGLGGGSITIAQNVITLSWFGGKELAMAFGCTLTVSRIGSVINFGATSYVFEQFVKHYNGYSPNYCAAPGPKNIWPNRTITAVDSDACRHALAATFWVGDLLIVASFLAAFGYLILDRRAAAKMEGVKDEMSEPLNQGEEAAEPKKKKMISCSDVGSFPLPYWIVCIIITLFYNLIFPFLADSTDFFKHKYGYGDSKAGQVSSLVYLFSMCGSIVIGRLIDYTGRRPYFALYGTGITVFIFAMFAQESTSFPPVVLMLLLGSSYCICASALWPSIQVLVEPETAGTANGIATSMQMLGIGLCNVAVGVLKDHTAKDAAHGYGYSNMMMFFAIMGALSFIFACWLNCLAPKILLAGERDKLSEGELAQLQETLAGLSHPERSQLQDKGFLHLQAEEVKRLDPFTQRDLQTACQAMIRDSASTANYNRVLSPDREDPMLEGTPGRGQRLV